MLSGIVNAGKIGNITNIGIIGSVLAIMRVLVMGYLIHLHWKYNKYRSNNWYCSGTSSAEYR